MKRRALSMLLVLAMVFSITPLAILAEEYPSITLNEEVLVELEAGSSVWYKFVPDKSTVYAYSSYDLYDVDPVCRVYNSEMTLIAENDDGNGNNFESSVDLTAGETYYFEFLEFDLNNAGSYKAKISYCLPTDFNIVKYINYTPHVGCEFEIEVFVYPEYPHTVINWSSSDNEVATVDQNGNVKLVGVGNAVITASVENSDFSDTFEITSKPSESIALGDVKTVIFDGKLEERDTIAAFRFVPEETAYYRMYSYDLVSEPEDPAVDPRLWIFDDYHNEIGYNDDGGFDVNFDGQAKLEKGKPYFFLVEPYDCKAIGEIKVTMVKCPKVESISIDCGDLTVDMGTSMGIYTTQLPEGCGMEEVTLSSSDESIVKIDDQTALFVGAGEATITARTNESGLESSITVTVLPIDDISLGGTFSIECNANDFGGYGRFRFIPTKSGVYRFESVNIVGDWDPAISLTNDLSEQLRYNKDIGTDPNCRLDYELVAGETYYIEVVAEGDTSESGSVDFKVTKVDESQFPTIKTNSSDEVVIDVSGNGKYYVFNPTFTGRYSIFSTPVGDAQDTKVFVLNDNWELFYSNDDGADNGQYDLQEEFTAGETYYIKSFLYSNDETGTHNINIKYLDGDAVSVTFDENGGTGTMEDAVLLGGSEYTLPENGFTAPAGMKFKAWSVDGVEKAVGDIIKIDADTTVTAVWEIIMGDVTGDSKINMFDYMKVKAYYFDQTDLTAEQIARADITGDGKIDMFDYMKIKAMVFEQ